MCGIAGAMRRRGVPLDPRRIRAMCDIQEHRGPDDAGYALFASDRDGLSALALTDASFVHLGSQLPTWDDPVVRQRCRTAHFDVLLGQRRLSIVDLSPAG